MGYKGCCRRLHRPSTQTYAACATGHRLLSGAHPRTTQSSYQKIVKNSDHALNKDIRMHTRVGLTHYHGSLHHYHLEFHIKLPLPFSIFLTHASGHQSKQGSLQVFPLVALKVPT